MVQGLGINIFFLKTINIIWEYFSFVWREEGLGSLITTVKSFDDMDLLISTLNYISEFSYDIN